MAKKRLISGEELTDELLDELVREAEEGYDPDKLVMVPVRGRPRLSPGEGPSQVIHVRVDESLEQAMRSAAKKQNISLSEYVRSVLRKHVPTS